RRVAAAESAFARAARDYRGAGVPDHPAAADGCNGVPEVLCEDGIFPVHADGDAAAPHDVAADQDGAAVDGEFEIHHRDSGVLFEFLVGLLTTEDAEGRRGNRATDEHGWTQIYEQSASHQTHSRHLVRKSSVFL